MKKNKKQNSQVSFLQKVYGLKNKKNMKNQIEKNVFLYKILAIEFEKFRYFWIFVRLFLKKNTKNKIHPWFANISAKMTNLDVLWLMISRGGVPPLDIFNRKTSKFVILAEMFANQGCLLFCVFFVNKHRSFFYS